MKTRATAGRGAWMLLLAGLASTGCVPLRALPDPEPGPPTVTLPATMAGIVDARAPFGAMFARELRTAPGATAAGTGQWLHPVPDDPQPDASRLAALDQGFAASAPGTSVLVLPGLFTDCFDRQSVPFGDGVVRSRELSHAGAYLQYADLGLAAVRSIPLAGRMPAEANGRIVAQAILAEAARPGVDRIVLVAYSKGVADALRGLAHLQASGGLPAALDALVSVAGVVMGSPLADQFEAPYRVLSPLVQPFDCTPSAGLELADLTRRESARWLIGNPPPRQLRYFSIVAYARHADTGPGLRPFHAALSTIDPRNDGQLFASDMVLPGSTLLAEARADHWDVALPRERDPNPALRALTSGRDYPREALFRATLRWVIGSGEPRSDALQRVTTISGS